VPVPAFSRHS